MTADFPQEFLVFCLCAAWCGTCRDYRAVFDDLATQFPHAGFHWVDVEEEERVADLDVDNFPTLLVQREELVLFFGPLLPQPGIARRTLESLFAQTPEESRRLTASSPAHAAWQAECNLRRMLVER
ncbi:MAG: thioredoxin family protein [Rhodocyclaceae bacterium]|jgi:thiol-disulfide isomerase/thioredoxin|nr:thioredoxin family protein [Rhodocyclaceae bacterium]